MARGRLLKTKVKEARKVSEAAALGTEIGKQKGHRKKKWDDSLREHIGKAIDRIDPLETIAVIGGAIAVHEVIFQTDEFIKQTQAWKNSDKVQTKIIANLGLLGFEGGLALDILNALFPDLVKKAYGDKPEAAPTTLSSDVLLWLLSFAISYFVFKHGGDLLNVAKVFFGFVTPSP